MDHPARAEWQAIMNARAYWPNGKPGKPRKTTRGPCRGCGKPLTGRRTSWCSDYCYEFREMRTRAFRSTVWNWSDKTCACCGLDIARLKALVRKAKYGRRVYMQYRYGQRAERVRRVFRVLGWTSPGGAIGKHVWEADHIIPKWDGGDHGPANGWVLCLGCHKAKSKREAKKRAVLRRQGLLALSAAARQAAVWRKRREELRIKNVVRSNPDKAPYWKEFGDAAKKEI